MLVNRDAARLIADRGHGLSRAQERALRMVAAGEVPLAGWMQLVPERTMASLGRLGLVCRGGRVWELTRPDGCTLAARMGLLPETGGEQ